MKFKTLMAVSLAGSLLMFGGSMASAETRDGINPWQHCGIGAAIFDDNTTAAAISNIIWDSGSTAVTSATLSPQTCSSKEIKVAMFINETYDQLIMETAMGEGEYLTTALELMSCDIKTSQVVISQLRSDLQQASSSTGFTNQDHADKAYQFYSSLNQAAVVCAG